MYKNILQLRNMAKNIQTFLSNNNDLTVARMRKNDTTDAILYKLYYTNKCSTQEQATIKLNESKNNKNKSSRQSLVKKENKLTADFYKKLSNKIYYEINKNCANKYTKTIIAVDGTFPTFLNTLSKDGFKMNKKGESVTPLITGLFNITTNYPVMLELAKDKNERKSFMDFVKNKSEFINNIFVFDRGYASIALFKFMQKNNMQYVCRIKENSKYVSDDDDKIILSSPKNGIKIRIIKYVVNDKNYYIATNVFDYSVGLIKNIYHDRWSSEEYYKYLKRNMKLAQINEKREKDIRKTILSHLIVSQLTFMFANINKKKKNQNKIVNKTTLTVGLYDKFLYKFFKNLKFTKYFLLNFMKIYVKYIRTNKGKSFDHTCKRPNFRWYFKKYFKNVKSKNL